MAGGRPSSEPSFANNAQQKLRHISYTWSGFCVRRRLLPGGLLASPVCLPVFSIPLSLSLRLSPSLSLSFWLPPDVSNAPSPRPGTATSTKFPWSTTSASWKGAGGQKKSLTRASGRALPPGRDRSTSSSTRRWSGGSLPRERWVKVASNEFVFSPQRRGCVVVSADTICLAHVLEIVGDATRSERCLHSWTLSFQACTRR